MLIEEPFFTLKIRPGLSPEQWADVAHALCKIAICPPPRPQAERRRVAVLSMMNLLSGSRSARAKQLAANYAKYLAGAWPREQALEELRSIAQSSAAIWRMTRSSSSPVSASSETKTSKKLLPDQSRAFCPEGTFRAISSLNPIPTNG